MSFSIHQSVIRRYLLSATLIGICTAARAIHIDAKLQERQAVAFWGGFTLAHSGTTCPSNTYQCVGENVVNGYDNSYACCPVGTYCWNSGNTYCCPDANDCGTKLETEQVCADTSWTLWTGPTDHGPFCCQEGETPIADDNAPFGECWSSGLPVISTEIASTLSQFPVTFLPFTATGHGAPATNTVAHPTSTGTSPSKTASAVSSVVASASKVILSKTAIIGIAVGGGVFLILLLLGVGCCCWKCCCKKKRRQQDSYGQSYEPYRQMDAPQENNLQKMEMQVLGGYINELGHH